MMPQRGALTAWGDIFSVRLFCFFIKCYIRISPILSQKLLSSFSLWQETWNVLIQWQDFAPNILDSQPWVARLDIIDIFFSWAKWECPLIPHILIGEVRHGEQITFKWRRIFLSVESLLPFKGGMEVPHFLFRSYSLKSYKTSRMRKPNLFNEFL